MKRSGTDMSRNLNTGKKGNTKLINFIYSILQYFSQLHQTFKKTLDDLTEQDFTFMKSEIYWLLKHDCDTNPGRKMAIITPKGRKFYANNRTENKTQIMDKNGTVKYCSTTQKTEDTLIDESLLISAESKLETLIKPYFKMPVHAKTKNSKKKNRALFQNYEDECNKGFKKGDRKKFHYLQIELKVNCKNDNFQPHKKDIFLKLYHKMSKMQDQLGPVTQGYY